MQEISPIFCSSFQLHELTDELHVPLGRRGTQTSRNNYKENTFGNWIHTYIQLRIHQERPLQRFAGSCAIEKLILLSFPQLLQQERCLVATPVNLSVPCTRSLQLPWAPQESRPSDCPAQPTLLQVTAVTGHMQGSQMLQVEPCKTNTACRYANFLHSRRDVKARSDHWLIWSDSDQSTGTPAETPLLAPNSWKTTARAAPLTR